MSDAVAPRVRCCRVVCLCAGGVLDVRVRVGGLVRARRGSPFRFRASALRLFAVFSFVFRSHTIQVRTLLRIRGDPASRVRRRDARAPRTGGSGENAAIAYRHMIHIVASRQFLATEVR